MKKGFTLVELLITISIIGILSSIALSAFGSAREKARIAKTNAELKQISDAMVVAQSESGQTLIDITRDAGVSGAGWVGGGNCMSNTDLRGVTQECYEAWVDAINAMQAATGYIYDGLEKADRDAWGSPYLLNENEGEMTYSLEAKCIQDELYSAGPDGKVHFTEPDDVANDDNILITIPNSLPECLDI